MDPNFWYEIFRTAASGLGVSYLTFQLSRAEGMQIFKDLQYAKLAAQTVPHGTTLVMKAISDSADRCSLVPAYVRLRTERDNFEVSNLVLTSLHNDQGSRRGYTNREEMHCHLLYRVNLVLSRVWNLCSSGAS